MSDQPNFDVDPPDRYAFLRRTIWITLLLAMLVCVGGIYYLRNTILPEELKSRMAQAFPGNSHDILKSASQMTLYSLQGECHMPVANSKPGQFHGYPVLGKTVLSKSHAQDAVALIDKAIADKWAGRQFCFQPHHGVRVVSQNQTLDLVICFQCKTLVTYSAGNEGRTDFGHAPEKYFNQLLENAGVPFDPQYKR